MKRFASNLSHSWWWDSHISHKNSKWLEENLESMDGSVKTMLKLIEEDADSFAKKAEMYYKKRPELISLVEEFYRRYRSLAERYDHLTGEIRKNMPASLRRELDGNDDESASEHGHEHDHKTRRKHRAAGFDFFLGSRKKEKHEDSSTSSSNSESDDEEHAMYVDLQQKTQEMEDTMNRLKEENELLGKELENKTSQMASLQEQTAVWQSRNSELESQIKSGLIHTEEIHDLRRQLHNLEGENHALKLRLRKSLEEYETSLSKITDLEAMAGSRNEGNLTLEEENFSLKQKQLEMLKQIDKLAGLNEECNHKFLEAGSKINLLLEENRVLKSEREEDLQRLSEDESTVSQLQEEASRLSKEKEDIRTQDLQQLGPLQTLIVQLQEELRLKDVKLDTLLKSNEDLTSQVQNIRSEYDTLKSNYDVCSGRLNELTQELEGCDRQNEILRAQNAALEKTHETVDSEKENLRVQLQDSIIECEELSGRLSIIRRELNDRVNVLERLNSSLELERDGLYNEKMKLEEEVTRLNSLLFDVQGQVNFWRDKAELIGSDFDLLHEDKIGLANDLSAMSLNHQELQSRVHQLEQNVAEMEKNVSMLQKEKQEMQNLAETLKQSQQALNEENLGLKTHLQTLTEDFVSKKERLKELQVEKFTLKLKSQRLLDGFTKIEQRVHLLQTEFDGLENENSHLKQDWQLTAKKLKEDISTLENDKSSLLGEVSLKVDEIDKLHEEISLLMSHKNELKIQLQLKSDHSAKLQSQIHDLQSLADKYLSQNEAVNNALTQMEAAKKMQEEEMRDLQRHLEDLHVENAQLIEASSNDADTISDLGSKVRLLNAQLNDLGHENLMQKNIISNRDEEKREAIRQLCIAIDHFRHNYKHLQHVLFLLHPSLRKANKN